MTFESYDPTLKGLLLSRLQQHMTEEALGWRRKDRVSDAPGWEVLFDAHGIHDPRPLAAIRQHQVRGEVCIHTQHPQGCVAGVDSRQRRGCDQRDRHGEVGHEIAQGPQEPRRSAEMGQVGRQAEGIDEE